MNIIKYITSYNRLGRYGTMLPWMPGRDFQYSIDAKIGEGLGLTVEPLDILEDNFVHMRGVPFSNIEKAPAWLIGKHCYEYLSISIIVMTHLCCSNRLTEGQPGYWRQMGYWQDLI